jgi:hypothetical protein
MCTANPVNGCGESIDEIIWLLFASRNKKEGLKVLSGQIRSAWERYHWMGLGTAKVFDFEFWSWFFVKSSKFVAASYKKSVKFYHSSADDLYRILSSYWLEDFCLMKKSVNRPPNIKWLVPVFLGSFFGGKDGGMCTHNPPAKEVEWLEVFLNEAAQNFELWVKI